jgi:hypothetical protein
MDILIVKSKSGRSHQNFYSLDTFEVIRIPVGTTLIFLSEKELTKQDDRKVHGKHGAPGKIHQLMLKCLLSVTYKFHRGEKEYRENLNYTLKLVNNEWMEKRSISGFVFLNPQSFKKYWVSHYDLENYKSLETSI